MLTSIRAAAILAALLAATSMTCDLSQKTYGPPVVLLRKEHRYLFNPVLSQDGNKLYYLEDSNVPYGGLPTLSLRGDLYVHDHGTETDRLLLAGDWYALALSRDGAKLALLPAKDKRDLKGTAEVAILDIGDSSVLTVRVPVPDGEMWSISDVALTAGVDHVVFNVSPGIRTRVTRFYFVTLPGGHVERIDSVPYACSGFDLLSNDSVWWDTLPQSLPSVNPRDDRWVVRRRGLWDRARRKSILLHEAIAPYGSTGFANWPTWMPDGKGIVFSAGDYVDNYVNPGPIEIWKLNAVLE